MKTGKKDISKDLIIETALKLIEENRGIKDVNLRGIAREIGCAHTSLYNYFNSFDEIIWEALGAVLLKMFGYVDANMTNDTNDEERFFSLLANTLDFSLKHPGWYRLIWLEDIGGKPSPGVVEILHKPAEGFNKQIIKASNYTITEEEANQAGNILHTYLHGELCKWINNRDVANSVDGVKMKILENLKYLYRLLIVNGGMCS